MDDKKIASADQWRAAQKEVQAARGELLTLPSGLTVRAARPDPLEWIFGGRIPQRLVSAVMGGPSGEASLSVEELVELSKFAVGLLTATILEPRIGDGPGEIKLDEIPMPDRVFLFKWACRLVTAAGKEDPSAKLGEFRQAG